MEDKHNPTTEGISPLEEKLNDLPVADEQSDKTKGGAATRLIFGTDQGVFMSDR